MGSFIDMTGQKYGRLTVVERVQVKKWRVHWLCQCDCGNKVVVESSNLRNGNTQSCGCYQRDRTSEASATHRMFGTRIYRIWRHIKNRCLNKKEDNYKHYGGRGIKVCEEWLQFEPFMAWALSHGYADNLTIDRIDVNGNYTPENCRWASVQEQHYNKRNTRFIVFNGEKRSIAEWANIIGVKYATLYRRLEKHPPEIALAMKLRTRKTENFPTAPCVE